MSFERNGYGLNIDSTVSPSSLRGAALRVFLGMADLTEDLARPLTDLVRTVKSGNVALLSQKVDVVENNSVKYGVQSLLALVPSTARELAVDIYLHLCSISITVYSIPDIQR